MRPKAIVIDIDGTLASSLPTSLFSDGNGGTDWNAWTKSTAYAGVHDWCLHMVKAFEASGFKIVFLTARGAENGGRETTQLWLDTHITKHYELFMRDTNDGRDDTIIKMDKYMKDINPRFDVVLAVDDKRTIVDMWKNLGISALHCGDF